jgi:hypothetical protein
MARLSPSQVTASSIDQTGLSVTVAPRRADDDRYGALYDLATLAGSVPVHFHPLTPNEYLLVFSRRWHSATPASDNPGRYTTHTEVIEPGWVRVSVPTGQRTVVNNTYTIPMLTRYDSTQLIDAVSRANEYLYLLTSATSGSVTTGVVSHWFYNTSSGSITEIAEEALPVGRVQPTTMTERAWAAMTSAERDTNGAAVTFDRGLWFAPPYLVVFGADADNQLFLARKPWGRIGYNQVQSPSSAMMAMTGSTTEDPRWTYWTGEGWSLDVHLAQPITDKTGAVITSQGPVSIATFRDRTLLATVAAQNTNRVAKIYTQRSSQPWEAESATVPLGVAGSTYLDTLRWQQQVQPSLSSTAMNNPATEVAIPYVVSTLETGSSSALMNTWALWSLNRTVPTSITPKTAIAAALAVTVNTSGSTASTQ